MEQALLGFVQMNMAHNGMCYGWTSLYRTDTSDCLVSFFLLHSSKPMYDTIWCSFPVQYNLKTILVQYQSQSHTYYDTQY